MATPGDAMRALYAVVSVDTTPAIVNLGKLNSSFAQSERNAESLLRKALELQGVLGRTNSNAFTAAGNALNQSFGKVHTTLQKIRQDAEKPIAITYTMTPSGQTRVAATTVNGSLPQQAGQAGGQAGDQSYLSRSMFRTAAYLGVYAAIDQMRQSMQADYLRTRAASITGIGMRDQMQVSRYLRRSDNYSPLESSTLQLAVGQLGVRDPAQLGALASAAADIHRVSPDIGDDEASRAIYRLALSTATQSDPQARQAYLNRQIGMSRQYASAILRASDSSAASPSEVINMLQTLEASGQISGLDPATLIALSSSLSSINPRFRQGAQGALTRLFGKNAFQGKTRQGIADLAFGGDTAALDRLTTSNDPAQRAELLQRIGQSVLKLPVGQRSAAMAAAGFSNVRDVQFMSELAATMADFKTGLTEAKEELQKGSYLEQQRINYLLSERGAVDSVTASFGQLTDAVNNKLGPAIGIAAGLAAGAMSGASQSSPLIWAGLGGLGGLAIQMLSKRLPIFGRVPGGPSAVADFLGTGERAGANRTFMQWARGNTLGGRSIRGIESDLLSSGASADELVAMRNMRGMFGDESLVGAGRLGEAAARRSLMSRMTFGLSDRLGVKFGETVMGRGLMGWGERMVAKEGISMIGARVAGRLAMGAAGGPVGEILAAAGLLAPVFHGISGWLDTIGQKGGLVGAVAKGFSLLFKALEFVGNIVNKVFDGIMWVVGGIMSFPPIKWLIDGASAVVGGVGKGFDYANNLLTGNDKAEALPRESNKAGTTNYYNVRVGSQAAFDQTVARGASRSVRGTGSQNFPAGS